MTATGPLTQVSPQLFTSQITDQYTKKNFDNLNTYFQTQNQLLNFNFFDISFPNAVTNQKVPHGLAYIPQDIVMMRCTGAGYIQFNVGIFDKTNMYITTSGSVRVRFFIGSYWNQSGSSTNASNTSDVMQYIAQGNQPSSTAAATGNTSTSAVTWVAGGEGNVITLPLTSANIQSGAFPSSTQTTYYQRVGDSSIFCNASGVVLTIQLLAPVLTKGIPITIKKTDTSFNTVLIVGNILIKGANVTSTTLYTIDECICLMSDGVQYNQIFRNTSVPMTQFYPKWLAYNTNGSAGTNPTRPSTITIDRALWGRDREYLLYDYVYRQSAATGAVAGTGSYYFPFPTTAWQASPLLVRGNSLQNFGHILGAGLLGSSSGGEGSGNQVINTCPVLWDGNGLVISMVVNGSSNQNVGYFLGSTELAVTNATLWFKFQARISINGWGY